MIEFHRKNHFAIISADINSVHTCLLENPAWGAQVLQNAGEYSWRITNARRRSKGPLGARVIDEGPNRLVAWGIAGKKSFMAYRIERVSDDAIRVIPIAFLERTRKMLIAVTLLLIFILLVLLAPIFWKIYEAHTIRASRVYLPAFCKFLIANGKG